MPSAALRCGVELDQLGGHVGHGFLDAGLGLLPGLRAQLVEDGRGAGLGGAVLLDEVEAGERDVELGGVGELEDHQLELGCLYAAGAGGVVLDGAQAAVLGDAVFYVDDVVADGEVAEVGDEGGGLGLAGGGAGGDVGVVGEVVGAEEDDLAGLGLDPLIGGEAAREWGTEL